MRQSELLFKKEVLNWIHYQYSRKKRTCPCGCNTVFTPSNKSHFFYNRKCYSRYHRLPGMIRKLMKGMD